MDPMGVILDMDGVLVDSYRPHFQSWQETARRHGRDMTRQQFDALFGRTGREIIRHLWPDLDDSRMAGLDEEKEAAYRRIIADDFPACTGANELIGHLHQQGFRLAIGSSGPPANVDVVCSQLPSAACFDARITGMDVKHGKPHPEVFLKAAAKLNLPPDRCAVIEDAPVGIRAARAAGMTAIAVLGTAGREALVEAGAHLVVESLTELSPVLISQLIDRQRPAEG